MTWPLLGDPETPDDIPHDARGLPIPSPGQIWRRLRGPSPWDIELARIESCDETTVRVRMLTRMYLDLILLPQRKLRTIRRDRFTVNWQPSGKVEEKSLDADS